MQQDGWTALIWASSMGYLAVVKALIEHHANIDFQSNVCHLNLCVCGISRMVFMVV